MLRFGYMPSDFNPMFLFLGDSQDLAALAGVLRSFTRSPKVVDFHAAIPGSVSHTSLLLVPQSGNDSNYGLKPDDQGAFRWGLNAWQAAEIAARIDLLTPLEYRSGSDIFELGVDGEIPVKVSRGEFEEEFLISKF